MTSGSLTVRTLRGTKLRLYYSDSGNVSVARMADTEVWTPPQWQVTRRAKGVWLIANTALLYLNFPSLFWRSVC